MKFRVFKNWQEVTESSKDTVFIIIDNWDDYGFKTTFGIYYVDKDLIKYDLKGIKIGKRGQKEEERLFVDGDGFDSLEAEYFSLGSSDEYYEYLKNLPNEIRIDVLTKLNDMAFDIKLFEKFKNQEVVLTSMLRFINEKVVKTQFSRLARGEVKLTDYNFSFVKNLDNNQIKLDFDVNAGSLPPTNVHVIIGKNGVGKTTLIESMIKSLTHDPLLNTEYFDFGDDIFGYSASDISFANVIAVSFSAFDDKIPLKNEVNLINDIKYSYIGIKDEPLEDNRYFLKTIDKLSKEFIYSLSNIISRRLNDRWRNTVLLLHSDTIFDELKPEKLVELLKEENGEFIVDTLFKSYSSGHKIILLTLTKLVENLAEKSLVIMDEPESHLHPPLLSSFVRALSNLLTETNGVSILATHSPVILQEVPKSCVWKLRRSGDQMIGERLNQESFGENIGILTHDIFKLEVTHSGFYKILEDTALRNNQSYTKTLEAFDHQLGMEARSILMALTNGLNNDIN